MEDHILQELSQLRARLNEKKRQLFFQNENLDILTKPPLRRQLATQQLPVNDIIQAISIQALQTTQMMNMLATQTFPGLRAEALPYDHATHSQGHKMSTINQILEDDTFDKMLERWRATSKSLYLTTNQIATQTETSIFQQSSPVNSTPKDVKTILPLNDKKATARKASITNFNWLNERSPDASSPGKTTSPRNDDSEKTPRRIKQAAIRQKWRVAIVAVLFIVIVSRMSKKSAKWKRKVQPLEHIYRDLAQRLKLDERLKQGVSTISAITKENWDMLTREPTGFLRVIAKRPSKWAITRLTHAIESTLQPIQDLALSNLGEPERRLFIDMTQAGDKLPRSFFWEKERECILGTGLAWPKAITDDQAITLIISLPVIKILISQMLMKPVEAGLLDKAPDLLDRNMKVLGLLIYRIAREACSSTAGWPWVDIEPEFKSVSKNSEKPFIEDINNVSDNTFKTMYKLYESTIKDEAARLKAWAAAFWTEIKSQLGVDNLPVEDKKGTEGEPREEKDTEQRTEAISSKQMEMTSTSSTRPRPQGDVNPIPEDFQQSPIPPSTRRVVAPVQRQVSGFVDRSRPDLASQSMRQSIPRLTDIPPRIRTAVMNDMLSAQGSSSRTVSLADLARLSDYREPRQSSRTGSADILARSGTVRDLRRDIISPSIVPLKE